METQLEQKQSIINGFKEKDWPKYVSTYKDIIGHFGIEPTDEDFASISKNL